MQNTVAGIPRWLFCDGFMETGRTLFSELFSWESFTQWCAFERKRERKCRQICSIH